MKKFSLFLIVLLLTPVMAMSEEIQPEQQVNNNTATISVQKQPTLENTQKQIAKQNKWCIIIQVNGKIKGVDNEVKVK